jgi:hypothetical protein
MNTVEKIRESNRIEGIHRDPTTAEIQEYERFMQLKTVSVADMEAFVNVYQPGKMLRESIGQNVRVGTHIPPEGGPHIRAKLRALLQVINTGGSSPWLAHVDYEMLHPFMDGNGRSGRMLWYWYMEALGHSTDLGFLHTFYYQTLRMEQSKRE